VGLPALPVGRGPRGRNGRRRALPVSRSELGRIRRGRRARRSTAVLGSKIFSPGAVAGEWRPRPPISCSTRRNCDLSAAQVPASPALEWSERVGRFLRLALGSRSSCQRQQRSDLGRRERLRTKPDPIPARGSSPRLDSNRCWRATARRSGAARRCRTRGPGARCAAYELAPDAGGHAEVDGAAGVS